LLAGGGGFVIMLALWAAARFVAAFTWRDARVAGPFCVEQLVLLGLVAMLVVVLLAPVAVRRLRQVWASRRAAQAAAGAG
jgi:hypothetical protein